VIKPDNTKLKASTILLENLNPKLTEIPITHIFKGQYFVYELTVMAELTLFYPCFVYKEAPSLKNVLFDKNERFF
jgi:hypothetical protein